jgi:hypothetical protein
VTLYKLQILTAAVALCGGFGGSALYNTLPASPRTLRAKAVEIVDERGWTRAILSARSLELLDEHGKARAALKLLWNDQGVLSFDDGGRLGSGRAQFGFALGDDVIGESRDAWGMAIYRPERRGVAVSVGTDVTGKQGVVSLGDDGCIREISCKGSSAYRQPWFGK